MQFKGDNIVFLEVVVMGDTMKHRYQLSKKIKYNNNLFQIVVREDEKIGFLKIIDNGNVIKYQYPSAQEFLHLNSVVNINNGIKF